jgi:hypothetical protein
MDVGNTDVSSQSGTRPGYFWIAGKNEAAGAAVAAVVAFE